MMRLLRSTASVLAVCLLGGCVLKHSQPARLYVLDAVAPPQAPAASAAAPVAVVGIVKVSVPPWMDRAEIAGRAPGGEITVDKFARWGEPIGRGIQRVVVENLATLLPDHHVVAAPFAARQVVDHRVEVTVMEAARQADGSILVEARWAILGKDGTPVRQQRSSHRAAAAAGTAGGVAGLNEALARLSADVAQALRAVPRAAEEPRR